jgi:hypothetical protein
MYLREVSYLISTTYGRLDKNWIQKI